MAVHLKEPVVLPLGTVHLSWTVSAEPPYCYRAPSVDHPPIPPFPRVLRWSTRHPSFRATGCCTGSAAGAGRRHGRCGHRGSGGPCSPSCAGARTTRSRSDPIFINSTVPTALCELCAPLKQVSAGVQGIVWVPGDSLEVTPMCAPLAAPSAPPRAVSVAGNGTSVRISWQPPPPAEQNGVIRDYRVSVDSSRDVAGPLCPLITPCPGVLMGVPCLFLLVSTRFGAWAMRVASTSTRAWRGRCWPQCCRD